MRRRCLSPKCASYKHYGARGITVCERWGNFWKFVEDMGKRPDGATLERIDNDGNYEPSNCRWATRAEQVKNTRLTRFFVIDGKRMCLADAARQFGITPAGLSKRIQFCGVERAIQMGKTKRGSAQC
jgi:hypothetical protein